MKSMLTIILALGVQLAYCQDVYTSDFEDKELKVFDVEEVDGSLVINDSITVSKGGEIMVNLPFDKEDFQFVERRKSGLAKIAKEAAGAVSSGAFAVGIGGGSISTMNGAVRVMRKADAIYYGADALERIDELPISKDAKKIAGKYMQVLGWRKEGNFHILTTKISKRKYEVYLEAAYVTREIILR